MSTARELIRLRDEVEAAHDAQCRREYAQAREAREARAVVRWEAENLERVNNENQASERQEKARLMYRAAMQSRHGKARRREQPAQRAAQR